MPFAKRLMATALMLIPFWPLTSQADSAMTVEVTNVRSDVGVIHLLAFATAEDFAKVNADALVGYATLPASKGNQTLTLPNLPTGCCALFVFHDENSNKDLDMSGEVPVEGYAFSGGEKDGLQPPFKQAIVATAQPTLPLIYW